MRQGMVLVLAGCALGAVAALAGTPFLRAFLYDVQPTDPRTLGAGVAVLIATALLADLVAALRASRTQPEAALRAE